ncbi:MAG: FHIPEP family type III secretion protein [Myxococcales bacterium]|nr:FHIPEP family type III secretion protein [Myxococcales bacterium]
MTGRSMRRGWGDLALAVIVVAVVAMMVVPLPALAIDLLLAMSFTSAVVILLSAVYAPSPARLTTLPTILLIATLFRLGVNVSTTRRILAEGDGGEVVRAFGDFVAQGELVVGLVVFGVITIVQYLVVARGAERVAEVAARFALDGLPGKQLAIDADLKAGSIDAAEAGRRRAALEQQSQLYGALDGAMKFVKGDALAAILIVAINLIGGLVIGVGSRGLSLSAAAEIYAVQSVGDGLVVQLPALLVALAAALAVTRIASADGERAVGDDMVAQLAAQPRALATTAVLLALLGLVPGLPHVPFLVLAAVAGGLTLVARALPARTPPSAVVASAPAVAAAVPRDGVTIAVAPKIAALLERDAVAAVLAEVRAGLASRLGVRAPTIALVVDPAVAHADAELRLWGTTVDWLVAPRRADDLTAPLKAALDGCAAELVRAGGVQVLLDELGPGQAPLVRDVVPRVASLGVLTDVLRQLVREGVAIHDLGAILEALAAVPAGAPKDAVALTEHVRGRLGRAVTAGVAPRGKLEAWTLDPMIEDAVRGAILPRDGGAIVALPPDIGRDIVGAVRRAVGERGVVLTAGDVRRHLRTVLEPELPGVAVVAPHELVAGVVVTPRGRVELA